MNGIICCIYGWIMVNDLFCDLLQVRNSRSGSLYRVERFAYSSTCELTVLIRTTDKPYSLHLNRIPCPLGFLQTAQRFRIEVPPDDVYVHVESSAPLASVGVAGLSETTPA